MINYTQQDIQDAMDDNQGYCTECKEMVDVGFCEPDAENYDCPECGGKTVMGVMLALVVGHLDF